MLFCVSLSHFKRSKVQAKDTNSVQVPTLTYGSYCFLDKERIASDVWLKTDIIWLRKVIKITLSLCLNIQASKMLKIGHIIPHIWEVIYLKNKNKLEATNTKLFIIIVKLILNIDFIIVLSLFHGIYRSKSWSETTIMPNKSEISLA